MSSDLRETQDVGMVDGRRYITVASRPAISTILSPEALESEQLVQMFAQETEEAKQRCQKHEEEMATLQHTVQTLQEENTSLASTGMESEVHETDNTDTVRKLEETRKTLAQRNEEIAKIQGDYLRAIGETEEATREASDLRHQMQSSDKQASENKQQSEPNFQPAPVFSAPTFNSETPSMKEDPKTSKSAIKSIMNVEEASDVFQNEKMRSMEAEARAQKAEITKLADELKVERDKVEIMRQKLNKNTADLQRERAGMKQRLKEIGIEMRAGMQMGATVQKLQEELNQSESEKVCHVTHV